MGVMATIVPSLREADELDYLTWCRQFAFRYADGEPSARRSAMRMNADYVRESGRAVPDQWVVR